VEFGKALVQLVQSMLSGIHRRCVVVYLVNCRMWQNVAGFQCKRCDVQLFREVVTTKEIMIS